MAADAEREPDGGEADVDAPSGVASSAGAADAPAPAPGLSPSSPGAEEGVMTLVDHLSELRRRIVVAVVAVAIGTAIGFAFAPQLISILKAPLGTDRPLVFTGLGDAFFIQLKLALVVGVVLAMPVLLFELWSFVSPGLTSQERRLARPWVPAALAFFALGVGVAYVVLPFASAFLLSFQSADLQALITADKYFDFVGTMFLAFGLVMEFPIVIVLLAKVGIVSSERLKGLRRYALLVIAVFAAVATPGGDIISPVVLAVVMYLLFELSIFLVRFTGR